MSEGPAIKKLKPKDGWRFAIDIREYDVGEEFDAVHTADIQDAYTNITDIMIKKAIRKVCEYRLDDRVGGSSS